MQFTKAKYKLIFMFTVLFYPKCYFDMKMFKCKVAYVLHIIEILYVQEQVQHQSLCPQSR